MGKSDKQPQEPYCISKLPRCQAIAKHSGKRCGQVAMKGKRVCYIHGGKSPGAPKGNKNGWKHGRRSKAAIEANKGLRALIKEAKQTVKDIAGLSG